MDWLVAAAFVLVGVLEIAVPLALAFVFARRFGIGKKLFLYGALFFVAVQVLHAPLMIFSQGPLAESLKAAGFDGIAAFGIISLYLGLLAGLFEEIGRFIVFKKFFPQKKLEASRENGLMFGAGWGGIESMIIGGLVFLALFSYLEAAPLTAQQVSDLNTAQGGKLTANDVQTYQQQITALMNVKPFDVLLGLFERLMTISLHLCWTLLVLAAVAKKKNSLLWLAVAWHAATDAGILFIAYASQSALLAEGALFIFCIPAIWYLWKNRPGKA
ncbi:MAG: YhfC family glutamic-type intramembrane protease [Candidatus Diapherotrites archaeon]